MGSVERVTRDGKVVGYQARWRDPGRAQRKRTFRRKLDAERFLTSITSDLLRGAYVDPHDRTTVGAFGRPWLAGQAQLKPSSRARSESVWRNQVQSRWDTTPLSLVTRSDVAAWSSALTEKGLAASSVRKAVGLLSQVLGAAVEDGRLARNVCVGVKMPRLVRDEPRFLSFDQVDDLAAAAGDSSLLIRFLALTGLRFGEAAALRVSRVDLLRRRIHVVQTVGEIGGHLSWGTPKTHATRKVPLSPALRDELVVHLAGRGPDDMVFTSPAGGVLLLGNFRSRVFDPALRTAGLPHFTPHDLRHTAASLAIASGASVKAVQSMLGHASAAMTLDVYAGLFPDELDAVADRLGAAWDASRAARVPAVCPEAVVTSLVERRTGS